MIKYVYVAKAGLDRLGVRHDTAKSSNVEYLGYDPDTQEMRVVYESGEYSHGPVPPMKFAGALCAVSIGNFLNTNIKPHYRAMKIERVAISELADGEQPPLTKDVPISTPEQFR